MTSHLFFVFFLALMLVRLMQTFTFLHQQKQQKHRECWNQSSLVYTESFHVSDLKWRSSYFLFPLTETGYLRTVDKRNGSHFRVRTTWTPPPVGGSCVRPNGPSWLPVWFCCFLVPRTLHQTWTLFKREPGPLLQKLLGGAWSRKSLTY